MRALLLSFTLVVLCFSAKTQQPQTGSSLLLGYQEFPTIITSHASDSLGNQYFTGSFRGQLTINSDVITTGNGLEDVFWAKTDTSGKLLRYKTYGSSNTEGTFPDALAMDETSHMLYGFYFQQSFNLDGLNVNPYSSTAYTNNTSCIAYSDTAGRVSWVKRINLPSFKIFYADGVFHVIGNSFFTTGPVKVEDSVVVDSSGFNRMIHLMFNKEGQLLSVKTIYPRKLGQSVSLLNLDFFSDKSLMMLLAVNSDTSFTFNNNVVAIPGASSNFMVLIKTDTAYQNFKMKVLNPQRQGMGGVNLSIPVCVGPGDSVYSIINYENSPNTLVLDGFTFAPQYNTFAVFDTSLTVRRIVGLGTSKAGTYSSNIYKRRIFLKAMFYQNGQFYFNGTYTGTNESPMNMIPKKDTVINLLPGVTATIDQNGPSRSFVARIDRNLSSTNTIPASLAWYGDHHEYENMTITPYFFHKGGKDRLVFSQNADNVWNPWIVDTNLNVVTGHMQRNADMPETPQMVRFFDDGSRLVIGHANGKTALDSAGSSFITNKQRNDIFLARISVNNQVIWYKRFFSTLGFAEVRNLEIKNNKAFFLVNYGNAQNDSNYLKVDSTVYSIGTTSSLMASIDSSGSINVISLNNSILKSAGLRNFSFFSNGDLALLTGNGPLQAGFANPNAGIHIFRVQPSTGVILDKRKITGSFLPSANTIQVDRNDQVYILNGEGNIPYPYTMYLYSTTSVLDSLKIGLPLSPQQCSLLKLNWSNLKWLKRSSGSGFSSVKTTGNLGIINNQPVVAIGASANSQPIYWDGQLIHNGFPVLSTSIVTLDSNGTMQHSKVMDGLSVQSARSANDHQFYLSGMLMKAIKADTIQVNFDGNVDGLSLVLDSTFTAKKRYRVGSPYSETMLDMDIYRDSVVALAYTAQGNPQLYTKMATNTGDYEEDAYLGTIITRTGAVTSVNNLPPSVLFTIFPNPVRDRGLHFTVGVNEILKSTYSIYETDGQYVAGGQVQMMPGTGYYSIILPAGLSKGVYRFVISNKKWTAVKTFVVL